MSTQLRRQFHLLPCLLDFIEVGLELGYALMRGHTRLLARPPRLVEVSLDLGDALELDVNRVTDAHQLRFVLAVLGDNAVEFRARHIKASQAWRCLANAAVSRHRHGGEPTPSYAQLCRTFRKAERSDSRQIAITLDDIR